MTNTQKINQSLLSHKKSSVHNELSHYLKMCNIVVFDIINSINITGLIIWHLLWTIPRVIYHVLLITWPHAGETFMSAHFQPLMLNKSWTLTASEAARQTKTERERERKRGCLSGFRSKRLKFLWNGRLCLSQVETAYSSFGTSLAGTGRLASPFPSPLHRRLCSSSL